MRFNKITIFAVTLVAPAIANPVPNRKAGGGMAIPLVRRHESPFSNSNKTIDLDAITSHGISVREKIISGLDNYERNTGTMHPFAVKRSESELRTRGAGIPLTPIRTHFWEGEISIGTPPKTLKVIIDTGSADMWVLGAGCSGVARDRNFWNPKSSKSAKEYESGQPKFQLQYSGGPIVEGNLFTDIVTIGGFIAHPQTFGSATSYTQATAQVANHVEFPADGLLGLAYPSISRFGSDTLFESLSAQGRLFDSTFSLKLSPSGGEMYIGGVNSQLYKGGITFTRVTLAGFWQVSMDDIRVNGDKIIENVPAVFDSGASYIYGDRDQVAKLYEHLGGTLLEHTGFGYYALPCDSFPTLGLTFGGKTFKIPPEVLRLEPIEEGSPYCFSAVIAESRRMRKPRWVIGLTFLQGVYSVFDYSAFQVGFADLA